MDARYDPQRTYRWNYDHAPAPPAVSVPAMPGSWTFLGRPVDSPLGVAAGPLLNGKWVRYYAALGFDILTYKTVRSTARDCYPLPNLLPVQVETMTGTTAAVPVSARMQGSWAVSFGMPSMPPEVWRADVESTRRALAPEKVLVVSVVGTSCERGTLDELAADYARCAKWAFESGADAVEANLSCPNVATRDGQLFHHPDDAQVVARALRDAAGHRPLLLKVGYFTSPSQLKQFASATAPFVDGYVMTNSIAARVVDDRGVAQFGGAPRGICGRSIRASSVEQVRVFAKQLEKLGSPARIIGVGGIENSRHVREYLAAGAEAVELATAAMVDPLVGCNIRRDFSSSVKASHAD